MCCGYNSLFITVPCKEQHTDWLVSEKKKRNYQKNTTLLNFWLYSRPKYAIPHARFLTWCLNFLAVFRAGFCTCCKLYSDPNPLPCPREVNVLFKHFELFLSTWHWTSLFICSLKRTNSLICSRSSLENHTRFQTIMSKIYIHFQTKRAQKLYPICECGTYIQLI